MTISDLYSLLFGRIKMTDGDVISMAEHGRAGGVSTGQGFKFAAIIDPDTGIKASMGGGTQYVIGSTGASLTGNLLLWRDATNTVQAASASLPLPVNIITGGAGDGSILDGALSTIKATVRDYANANPLSVVLTDTNGDYIAAGGGTQYQEGYNSSGASLTGTMTLWKDVNSLSRAASTSLPFPINNVGNSIGLLQSGSTLPIVNSYLSNIDVLLSTRLASGSTLPVRDAQLDVLLSTRLASGSTLPVTNQFLDVLLSTRLASGSTLPITNANLDVALSTRLASGSTLPITNSFLDIGLSTRLASGSTLPITNSFLDVALSTRLASGSTLPITNSFLSNLDVTLGSRLASGSTLPITGNIGLLTGTNSIGTVQPGNTANTTPWLVTDIPAVSGGLSKFHLVSAATTNATNIKASAGQVYAITAFNLNASPRYLKFHNTAGTPTAGASVTDTYMIPGNTAGAGEVFNIDKGISFSTGIAITLVTGITDADAVAVAASEIVINIYYK